MQYQPLDSINPNSYKPFGSGPGSSTNLDDIQNYNPNPMGTKATAPQDNVTKPNYSITRDPARGSFPGLVGQLSKVSPYGAPGNQQGQNYLFDSANSGTPADNAVGGLYGFARQLTPEVKKAQDDYNSFAQSAPYMVAAQNNPNVAADIASGRSSLLGQTFGQVLGAKAQGVNNAINAAGQQIGAYQAAGNLGLSARAQNLGAAESAAGLANTGQSQYLSGLSTAAGYAAPQQVSPGNFYLSPETGRDATGGNVTPGSGGARMAQVGQGKQYQENLPIISAASGYVNSFNDTLKSSGLLSSDLNLQNLVNNVYASNTSNPAYAKLQQDFSTALSFYSSVLGQEPQQLISDLSSTGKGSTVSELLQNLDLKAREYNQHLYSASQGNDDSQTINQNAPGGAPGGQGTQGTHAVIQTQIGPVDNSWFE